MESLICSGIRFGLLLPADPPHGNVVNTVASSQNLGRFPLIIDYFIMK